MYLLISLSLKKSMNSLSFSSPLKDTLDILLFGLEYMFDQNVIGGCWMSESNAFRFREHFANVIVNQDELRWRFKVQVCVGCSISKLQIKGHYK